MNHTTPNETNKMQKINESEFVFQMIPKFLYFLMN